MFMSVPSPPVLDPDLAQHHDRRHLVLRHGPSSLALTHPLIRQATGGGGSIVNAPGKHAAREIYWARYADWLGTTPLLLLDLALLAGLSGVDIVLISIADVGMIVTGVAAALDVRLARARAMLTSQNGIKSRWGLYTFSCLFFRAPYARSQHH